MKICLITRPPIKKVTKKFRMGRYYIMQRIEEMGHEVVRFVINPLRIRNLYLAYGLAILLSPFRFRKIKAGLIFTHDLESSIAAVLIKFFFKIPFVFNFVDDYSCVASYEDKRLRVRLLEKLEKIIPRLADLVLVIDPPKENFCLDLGIPKEKVRMIPNGVDTGLFTPGIVDPALRDELNPQNNRFILFIGKINRYYRLDVIVSAVPQVVEEFPNTKFVFVGEGNDVANLKALAHKLKIDRWVAFTGYRTSEEIPKIINLSDICVFPLPDSSALAVLEFMAAAKPMVLPRGGTEKMWISEKIVPEDCAIQVEASPEGFAGGILYLLKNETVGKEMGLKARERAVRFHDWSILSQEYLETFEKVTTQRPMRKHD